MKAIPTIQKYMTVLPHTIGKDQTLKRAEEMMNEYKVRHLPVLDGGKLVGILTDRDIRLVESFKDVNPDQTRVEDAFTEAPYVTTPNAPLNEVCANMVANKYGCTLVCDNHKLVGIFTWVDALKAFDELLTSRLKH